MTLPLEHGLLFAHTPKTAGTSFRKALLDYLGRDHLVCDYNQGNRTTSEFVDEHFYGAKDAYHFGKKLAEFERRFCLTGHFAVPRHSAFFPAHNVLIFFRDPVQQVLSNYGHRQRVNGFDGDLEAFCKVPAHRDVQAKTLAAFPLGLLGYIGLQEYYAESLVAINRLYDLALQECAVNVNQERVATGKVYACSADDLRLIQAYNPRDFSLYDKAKRLFLQRREIEVSGQYFVHGCVAAQTLNKIDGWALRYDDSEPVDLTISVNGKQVAEVRARDFRVNLKGWNATRQGFVGFTYLFKQPLAEADRVECRVTATDQLLFRH